MKFFKTLVAAVAICLAAVSCTKDETLNLDGTYKGNIVMAVGEAMPPIEGTMTIKDCKNGTLTIVTPTFAAMGGKMTMPALEIKNVKVTEAEGLATLEAEAFTISLDGKDYVSAKGLSGTVKEGKLNVAYDIKPGAMPMTINFTFEGTK